MCAGPDVTESVDARGRALVAALGGRTLIGHDVKALAEWWLARGGTHAARRGHRGRRVPAQPRAHQLQARGGVRGAARRGPRHRAAGHARQVDLGPVGDGAARARRGGAQGPLRGRRAAADRRARRDGASRHPGRPGPARRVLPRARGAPRADHEGDLRAGGRGVQHRLAEAARLHPVREAQAAGRQADQDRLLDRRRRARAARPRPRAARAHHRAPHAGQAQVDVRRRAAHAGESDHRAHPHLVQPARGRDRAAVV